MKKTFLLGIGLLLTGLVVYATSITTDVNSIQTKGSSDYVTNLEFNKIIGVLKGFYNVRISDTEYHIGMNGSPSDNVDLTVHGAMRTEPVASNINCNSTSAGTMFFNSTDSHLWGCNGTDIVKLDGVTEYDEFTCTAGAWTQGDTCFSTNYNSGNTYNPSDVVCASSIPNNDTCNAVACGEITDVNLQAAIVANLGLASWAEVDTAGLESIIILSANNQSISSMEGICKLKNIQILDLSDNSITGSIPSNITTLNHLTSLLLDNNQLSGEIPTGIGSLTSLRYLLLDRNELSGSIPTGIGSLTSLENLSLYDNQLSGSIPTEIGNLTSLTNLNLQINEFTGSVPSSIGNLTSLTSLSINNNQLTSIPTEVNNLTGLATFFLQNNASISTFPDGVYASTRLRVENTGLCCGNIDQTNIAICMDGGATCSTGCSEEITDVNLQNAIATQLGKSWASVTTADLEGITSFTAANKGIVSMEGICKLVNLTYLNLNHNPMTGSIPSSIGDLTSLNTLYLYSNDLTGAIPSSIGNLINLTKLSLGGNYLTGSIPTEIGSLVNLTDLNLQHNGFTEGYNGLTGAIPNSIENLVNLTSLVLDFNSFTGAIPSSIGNLINLTKLQLHNNQLTGTIPSEIWNLTNLSTLTLGNNQLTGAIPSSIENLTNLFTFGMEGNQFISIPNEISNLTKLAFFYLNDNPSISIFPSGVRVSNRFQIGGNTGLSCSAIDTTYIPTCIDY